MIHSTFSIFRISVAALLLTFSTFANAQVKWASSLHEHSSFIPSMGQFDARPGTEGRDVRYVLDGGLEMVYFTPEGPSFSFAHREKNLHRKWRDQSQPKFLVERHVVHCLWEGAEASAELIADNATAHRYTYAALGGVPQRPDVNLAAGFRELTYRNLYPNVDVTYRPYEKGGVKYDILLCPGSDARAVSLRYDFSAGSIAKDASGNLRITTSLGDMVDHAPVAYYLNEDGSAGERIAVEFVLNGRTVSFKLGAYDKSKSVLIDPWVVTPVMPNANKVFDVDVDESGNVYVYGGDTPARLMKYSQDGTLIWVFNTGWNWNANTDIGTWTGGLVTHPDGTSYITNGSSGIIARISTDGVQQWTASGGGSLLESREYWKLIFNCDNTKLFVAGTRLPVGIPTSINFYGEIFEISTVDGSIISSASMTSSTFAGIGGGVTEIRPNEVRSICSSQNGEIYFLTLDTVGSCTQELVQSYGINSSYNFTYRCAGYGLTNMGINAIGASTDFMYTQNGSTLHKRNINTGVVVATATIPNGQTSMNSGQNEPMNSGLLVDSCGFVFVGSMDGVHKFDGDLNLLGSVSTPNTVYDIAFLSNGEIVACGQGFLAAVEMENCTRPEAVCLECLQLSGKTNYCISDGSDTLTANFPGGTWVGPGIIDEVNGVFDPSVAGTGTHVVQYLLPVGASCGLDFLEITVSLCGEPEICIDEGTIYAYNGTPPYQWQVQVEELDCSGCGLPIFCGTPFCPGETVLVFQTDLTGNSYTPTSYPVQLVDAAGQTLLIEEPGQVIPCNQACQLEVSVIQFESVCVGENNGSATSVASSNIGTVNYAWNTNPVQTTAAASGLSAGTYIVTATDAFGCTDADTVTIAQYPAVIAYAGEDSVICLGDTIVLSATGGMSYAWDTGDSTQQITVAPPMTTSYSVIVMGEGNCTDSAAVIVIVDERICLGLFPNVISPGTQYDGDLSICGIVHQNNAFQLPCLELYPGNRVIIFDRWGRKRHEATNYHLNPWDGSGGSEGVYYWVLELPDTETIHQGFFHILK